MYHSTGDGTWTGQSSPTAVLLTGVLGSGPSDVYAAGDQGTIQRPRATARGPSRRPIDVNLYAVWGAEPRRRRGSATAGSFFIVAGQP